MNDTTRLLERLAATFPDRPAPLSELVAAAHVARRRRARRNVALAAGACVLAVTAGITVQQVLPDDGARRSDQVADIVPACDRGNPGPQEEPVPRGPDYPTNAAGETYGSAIDNSPQPDLLAAIGDCGSTGYVRRTDLEDPPPWIPGAGSDDALVVPLYEADGTTPLDTYTREPGSPQPSTEAPGGPDAADVRGEWNAMIAGVTDEDGNDQYDTFRDLDLTITFAGDEVRAFDGCQTWAADFTLVDGELEVTTPFASGIRTCDREAPLNEILFNVRHVSEAGGRTYLHLENFQIAVSLTPR
jgi:hypothetical protein